jgi:hypothetical protein
MILAYNANGLLCMWEDGRSRPIFIWHYSVFEEFFGEAITPSVYKFLAEYVRENFKEEVDGKYQPGNIEEDAYVSYYEVPLNCRIRLHREMTRELENLLDEEETWRGGHEAGAENNTNQQLYCHYDEI